MKGTIGTGRAAEGGEIVQVQGGHILRATGRKDRHSKVYTSKGPRDRRVRLSAHTAIQFYDVQDRLGYDRPSKAVDWLIDKAKNAIDKLQELPPWHPNTSNGGGIDSIELPLHRETRPGYPSDQFQFPDNSSNNNNSNNNNDNPGNINSSSYIPHQEEHEDAMKAFFPLSFPDFPNEPVPNGSFGDLGLSLQSNYRGNSSLNGPVLPFQENFERMDGWNGGRDMVHGGIPINSTHAVMFSDHQRELLIQSSGTAAVLHAWNINNHDYQRSQLSSSDFCSNFDLGFRLPARIYGQEEPQARNE